MIRLGRRTFLTGAAGTLALPLLDSLSARAAEGDSPRRIVLFYNPNGTVKDEWFPQDATSETEFTLGKIHAPLAKYRDRMTILGGINSTVAQDPRNNGGPHQRGIGSLFTGQMLEEGEFTDGCGKKAGWAAGQSIDQVVAEQLGTETIFRSLELGVRANSNDVQGRIVYSGAGQPLPPINDPAETYERLFMRTEPLDPSNPDSRRQSILDSIKDQFAELDKQVGQDDRLKLERHLALVEDYERRLGLVGTPESSSCIAPLAPPILLYDDENTMPDVSRLQLDMLAGAIACDLTRVASVQYSTGFNRIRYPWVDSLGEGHSLSHSGDSNADAWNALTERAAWHAGEIAYLMDRLAEIPEGDGTALDNTLIVWGNEVAQGNSHALDDIPYLLLGNLGGSMRSGRYVTYEGASSCDLLHALLQAFDIEVEGFGHPDHNSGVLSGLLS